MSELFEMSVLLHAVAVLVLLLNAIYHLYILSTSKDYKWLEQRLYTLVPFGHIVLSIIFFTGLIAFSAIKFTFSFYVFLMCIVWVYILVGGIKTYKQFKARAKNKEGFLKFAKIKYAIDIVVIIIFFATRGL